MNPYAEIVSEMQTQAQRQAPPGRCTGTVVSIGPGTLEIQTDRGMILDKEDLLINPALLYGAEEEQTVELLTSEGVSLGVNQMVSCYAEVGPYMLQGIRLGDLPGVLTGTLTGRVRTNRLKPGDRVLMLPSADGQLYYVICKVVTLDE